jgi:hydrogenase-4 component B
MPPSMLAIDLLLALCALWLITGFAALAMRGNMRMITRWLFPVGALTACLVGGVGVMALLSDTGAQTAVLVTGLPGWPMHFRLDALCAVFVVLLGFSATGVSIYACGYFRSGDPYSPGLLGLAYHGFLASMLLVLLADDSYAFMVAWEAMALSSFFLVTADHRHAEIRQAGYLYLVMAHISALFIVSSFGVLMAMSGDYTFSALRTHAYSPAVASLAFVLALVGFGGKAGLVPLHVWLPEAHPAAPSPISALMSAVMLKTAIYGLLRISFDLLGSEARLPGAWWWGLLMLFAGLGSALFGVLYSTVQSDMKRLLAYSSIENMGVIAGGMGLSLLFHAYRMDTLAACALTAALVHCWAHAGFKSMLFLTTGCVMHGTRQRSLGRLGGLIHRMPWTAWAALVAVIAGAGLPPLSGFVAEWLLLQAFLFSPALPQASLNMVVPVAAAVVVLVAALAGFALVKFYGIVFLGQMREPDLANANDAGIAERFALIWLGLCTLVLGVCPAYLIPVLDGATRLLLGQGLPLPPSGWLMLAPISQERASYQPMLFLSFILVGIGFLWLVLQRFFPCAWRRCMSWDCGYSFQNARMQDTAEGFSQPIRRLFAPIFHLRSHYPAQTDAHPVYDVHIGDHCWRALYLPFSNGMVRLFHAAARLQSGRIAAYLLYSFMTLLFLLLVARP